MTPVIPDQSIRQELNSRYDLRAWFNAHNNSAYSTKARLFVGLHTLGCQNGKVTSYDYALPVGMHQVINTWTANSDVNYFLSAMLMPYNLPYLTPGQAYIRKMRIPGWNPECKGEIYLLWSPVTSAYQSGDIVEVGSKSYAIITEGAVCWAARVS
jgi:hypothetical protein